MQNDPPSEDSAEKAAYIALRLSTQTPREKATMEACLRNHPGLTREEFMEMAIAFGF